MIPKIILNAISQTSMYWYPGYHLIEATGSKLVKPNIQRSNCEYNISTAYKHQPLNVLVKLENARTCP